MKSSAKSAMQQMMHGALAAAAGAIPTAHRVEETLREK
jgi:hypothetical protein